MMRGTTFSWKNKRFRIHEADTAYYLRQSHRVEVPMSTIFDDWRMESLNFFLWKVRSILDFLIGERFHGPSLFELVSRIVETIERDPRVQNPPDDDPRTCSIYLAAVREALVCLRKIDASAANLTLASIAEMTLFNAIQKLQE